ncbi:hypothetical protein GC176_12480 [bacterium]|nr:hypothetical protein [bacterium]
MRNLTGTAMWAMAAMTVLGVATSAAQAGHYMDIDDHARDIDSQAERAQRIVKYDFRDLPVPIQQCLLTNLNGLEENADCVRDLTRHGGQLDEIARHVQVMSRQLADVEHHIDELRTWARSCFVPPHLRSSCGMMSRAHERSLNELCERTQKIGAELQCLTNELNQLLAARQGIIHHSHVQSLPPQPVVVVPPPAPRPPVQPSVQIGFGTAGGFNSWTGRGGRHHAIGRSNFGRGQNAVNVPLFQQNGRSFGFSLTIR